MAREWAYLEGEGAVDAFVAGGVSPSWVPPQYSCGKHGMHGDWLQFRWSARAGVSNLYCLRCFADHLETALPTGGVVVPPAGGGPP